MNEKYLTPLLPDSKAICTYGIIDESDIPYEVWETPLRKIALLDLHLLCKNQRFGLFGSYKDEKGVWFSAYLDRENEMVWVDYDYEKNYEDRDETNV